MLVIIAIIGVMLLLSLVPKVVSSLENDNNKLPPAITAILVAGSYVIILGSIL